MKRIATFIGLIIFSATAAWITVYDLVWYFGLLDVKNTVQYIAIFAIILCSILTGIVILQGKDERFLGLTRKEQLCVKAIFIASTIILCFWLSINPVRSMNNVYDVQRNNVERQRYYDESGNFIAEIGGVSNISSVDNADIFILFNGTILTNVTEISIFYYNGTSRNRTATPKFYENGFPNRYRWTDELCRYKEGFEFINATSLYYGKFSIPCQEANTTVEYIVVFRIENVTGSFYRHYEGFNYTVLYSEGENEYVKTFSQTGHLYLGIIIFLWVFNLIVYKTKSAAGEVSDYREIRRELNKRGLIKKLKEDKYPSTWDLVARSDRMNDVRNDIRNTAGLFLALLVGFLLYLQDNATFNYSIRFTDSGIYFAILFCLGSILLSLSNPKTEDLNYSIEDGLLPPSRFSEGFRFLLCKRIMDQQKAVRNTRAFLQAAVASIIIGLLVDMVLACIPKPELVTANPILNSAFLTIILLLLIFVMQIVYYVLESIGYELPDKIDSE